MGIWKFIKGICKITNVEEFQEQIVECIKKDDFDFEKVIQLGHDKDKLYEYYQNELKHGATHYRISEDRERNAKYDMDDLEDSFCYLKIEIFYDNKKKYHRYSVLGEVCHCTYDWKKINPDVTKDQLYKFIVDLGISKNRYFY